MAAAESVSSPLPTATIVVPGGMPVPVMTSPGAKSPVVVTTLVIVFERQNDVAAAGRSRRRGRRPWLKTFDLTGSESENLPPVA